MLSSTVLIIDDDEHIVDLLEFALQMKGYRVLVSVNGAALQLARDMHPDLILLDINMPGMSGIEISQHLRADPATADIPQIAMSAIDTLRSATSEMLADDRLPKPFELERLYQLVAHWIHPH